MTILRSVLVFVVIFLFQPVYAQNTEFKEHNNGLIYNDTTMSQLRFIVDSMNLKYKQCDLWKNYYSLKQTIGYHVRLDSGRHISKVAKDIESGISYNEFIKNHPEATVDTMLVLKKIYLDYQDKYHTIFRGIIPESSYEPTLQKDTSYYTRGQMTQWIFEYQPKAEYSAEYVDAFYFPNEFEETQLPLSCARMIQYADCMVDTSASVFFEQATSWIRGESTDITDRKQTAIDTFIEYLHKETNHPKYQTDLTEKNDKYWDAFERWYNTVNAIVEDTLSKTPQFRSLLHNAVEYATAHKQGNAEIEYYAEKYYDHKTLLTLKRSRIVMGGCSQDESPRYHALDIAKLSAETINWEIFLRAHLDIMNDNFSRVAESNNTWGRRKTYLREIEALDIDVTSLILGISFRISNPSGNHYVGDISRLGRAISESKNKTVFEQKMIDIVADKNLDLYNRICIYYLMGNYVVNLDDINERKIALVKLKDVSTTFPYEISKDFSFKSFEEAIGQR